MNLFFKIALVMVICCTTSLYLHGSDNQKLLAEADSLYEAKKYTEAFQLYQNLFTQNQGSPAMLTKMAFIKEGLGDYANALYYLNLYYNQTSDRKALSKMRELAESNDLVGYEYSDGIFITGVIKRYRYPLLLLFVSLSLLITFYIYRKKQAKERPFTSVAMQLITLLCALVLINNVFFFDYGIVSQGNSLLMAGPSAGAEPVEIIGKGHKLRLVHRDKVWSKVIWNEEEVFIRNTNLKSI